jgi:hypothetical protein
MESPTNKPVPHASIQSMFVTQPNELRLKELLDLQNRKLMTGPGPNAYSPRLTVKEKKHFRRANIPDLDGPFLPTVNESKVETTRDKEISLSFRLGVPDSGLAPGQYDSHLAKEAVLKAAPAVKIGTSSRTGKVNHAKSLSISRSIQHGIDYHATVVLVPANHQRASKPKESDLTASPQDQGGEEETFAHSPSVPLVRGPAPPAAVARTIKKDLESSPGDWNWQRLGHNYRANFSTQGGGAFSKGDRSTARRDLRAKTDAMDLLPAFGIEPTSLPYPSRDTLAGPQGTEVQRDERYGRESPIMGLDSRGGLGPMGDDEGWSMPPTPAVPNLTYSPNQRVEQQPLSAPIEPELLLSEAQMRRRDEALRAVMEIQAIQDRRAQWNQKSQALL